MPKPFTTSLSPPFLKNIAYVAPENSGDQYPFNIGFLKSGKFDLEIRKKVLIIVGDNGTGKSTLLEGVAANCGFSLIGGSKNHVNYDTETASLAKHLRMSWRPKITSGFFLRAETMFSFIRSIDTIAAESGNDLYDAYGGRSLARRSHGEAFLSIFEKRFGRQGIYIMDEPEAALSPERQLEFLRLIKSLDNGNRCQLIIATHSPMVMAYPNAQLVRITGDRIKEVQFHEMPHFKILRDFCLDPDAFMQGVLMDD